MKLDRAAIVLRPRTVPEIVDLALRLIFSIALPVYTKLAAVVLLPLFAGAMALHYAAKVEWRVVWVLAFVAATFAQGAFTVAAGRLLFSEDLGVKEVLGAFFKRLPSYVAAMVLSRGVLWFLGMSVPLLVAGAWAAGLGTLIFAVGLPFAWVALMFAHEASLLEGAGPGQAWTRSSRFIRGRGGPAFALLLLLLLGQAGAVVIAELLGQSVLGDLLQLGKPFGSLWEDLGSPFAMLGLFASVPLVSTARFLHYIDTRTRADGWDIQVRFLAIAAKDGSERRMAA